MATFNGEKYLREQLVSFAKQTILPLELVVCDDCSTDSTASIINNFAVYAPFPVRFYRNDVNLGFADNFFKAAKLCTGEWIAFSDQDDIWLPNKLAIVQRAVENSPCGDLMLVAHTSLVADQNLRMNGKRLPSFSRDRRKGRKHNYPVFVVAGFSIVFRSLLVRSFDPQLRPRFCNEVKRIGHDYWISILANTLGTSCYLKQPLAIWRRHESAMTTSGQIDAVTDTSVISKINKSRRSLSASQYFVESTNISILADSLASLYNNIENEEFGSRLVDSAADLVCLADSLTRRGKLYESSTHLERLKSFIRLLRAGAYGTSRYRSLSVNSLLKDVLFAFGFLRA